MINEQLFCFVLFLFLFYVVGFGVLCLGVGSGWIMGLLDQSNNKIPRNRTDGRTDIPIREKLVRRSGRCECIFDF